MSDCLHLIVRDMCEFLSAAQLKLVLLNAIPERSVQVVHSSAPKHRPGMPARGPTGPSIRAAVYDEAYEAQFPDTDALEYLEEIRGVVQSLNPSRDPDTLRFLLSVFDEYYSKPAPVFFQPILIIFKKWSEVSAGNPPTAFDPLGVGEQANLSTLLYHMKMMSLT